MSFNCWDFHLPYNFHHLYTALPIIKVLVQPKTLPTSWSNKPSCQEEASAKKKVKETHAEKNVKETHFYLHQIQEKSSHKYLHSFANHFFQIRSHLEKKKYILPNYNQRKNKNKEMEIEWVKCECCGLKEDSSQDKWICGFCSKAVWDEVIGGKNASGVKEVVKAHMSFCRKFKSNLVVRVANGMWQMLRRRSGELSSSPLLMGLLAATPKEGTPTVGGGQRGWCPLGSVTFFFFSFRFPHSSLFNIFFYFKIYF